MNNNRINKTPQAHEQKYANFIHTNPPFPTPSSHQPSSTSSLTKISPILILVIILLAVIFFIAGLVHLLLRFFIKRPIISSPIFHSNRFPENSLALQRQLRQLFRLHDSGLDQASIDALPIFRYMDVVGPKQPFDCAVCLAEFSQTDSLRLLPPCSHAFHAACIDTWLLSNSSCPLCRHVILASDLPMLNFFDDQYFEASGGQGDQANGDAAHLRDRVFSIRLGKFSSSNESEAETSRCNMDARRCYSMGTCRYVVGEEDLRVALRCEGNEDKVVGDGKKISRRQKGESFSVSKIWLWSKNGRFPSCSDTDIHLPTSLGASFRGNSHNQSSQMVCVDEVL